MLYSVSVNDAQIQLAHFTNQRMIFFPHVGISGTSSTTLDLTVKLATFLAAIPIENMETKTSKQNFLFLWSNCFTHVRVSWQLQQNLVALISSFPLRYNTIQRKQYMPLSFWCKELQLKNIFPLF